MRKFKYQIRLKKISGTWKDWSEVRTIEAGSKVSAHKKLVGPHIGRIQVRWIA